MLNMHPDHYLALHEQDRERAMTQRALERAARAGGEQRPGLFRGGIIGFTRIWQRVAAAAGEFHSGHAGSSALTGSAEG